MPASTDRNAEHWRLLGLIPGAPGCVIKAAHRYQIEQHHPDRGGDVARAQRINVARDEVAEQGASANDYVAANYHGEPWLVLGLMATADSALVERAGASLRAELASNQRLLEKVAWAMRNFGNTEATRARGPRGTPPPPTRRVPAAPRRERRDPAPSPSEPVTPGLPDGLPVKIVLGDVPWGSEISRQMKLTWKVAPPYDVRVEAPPPLRAQVAASKALPGRFVVTIDVDWASDALAPNGAARGHNLAHDVVLRWGGAGEARVRVLGAILYPARIAVDPGSLDLGVTNVGTATRASLMLAASAAADVSIEGPAWLERVDAAGKRSDTQRLNAGTAYRTEFAVVWKPILARAADAFARGKPVRPTGRIIVRWEDQEIGVPVEMVVRPPR